MVIYKKCWQWCENKNNRFHFMTENAIISIFSFTTSAPTICLTLCLPGDVGNFWQIQDTACRKIPQVLWAKDLKGQLKFLCLWFWVKYHCREVGIEGRDNRHPSNLKVKVKVAQLFLTLYDPMEFSRPEYWSGLLFPSPGDLPNPGIKPRSPALQVDSLPAESPGKSSSSGPWESELEEEQV